MRKLPARNDFNAKLNYKLKYNTARGKEGLWERGSGRGGIRGKERDR